ncbi:MAG: Hsp20/alpha crystallin family protein [Candidatus Cyclobacteriaceae bacterium M2_1C_046]
MKFNKDNNRYSTNILKVVDTLNTINGGMVAPVFKLEKEEDEYQIVARVPGVSPESLRVEVVENKLMIYHLMDFGASESEIIPNVLNVVKIPKGVDISKIYADYEGKMLIVHMPVEDGFEFQGYHRSIDINLS